MKAYQYSDAANGLELKDVPVPQPGADEVLIRVKAAGMCHSDCHIYQGKGDSWLLRRPITLGHEVAGEIIETGSNVIDYRPGDRVAVYHVGQPVEERKWAESIGLGFDGGYAEFATPPVSRIRRIPEGVSFAQAAVATDALATSYQAVVSRAGAKKNRTIGVIGLGGLGMSGLAFGVIEGATVYGFDIMESKFEEAKRLGATECFKSTEQAKEVVFDAFVDFVGAESTTQAALSSVKEGGTVVLVGLATDTTRVPTHLLITRSLTLAGSIGASKADLDRVLDLLQQGSIDPLLVEVPFHEIPATLDKLDKGKLLVGRYWADPSKI
ncbi:GroES-like protein [Corynespora cassiicola Philippines]|uniref:GroES-like protein n=1 Tax=Corynespora cassiicola Philippines TaxID=1448308 RepID=A0A2T2NPL3_CORCC|nr:GroES-like protein [Corynespora cassiicola Philippines]